PPYSINGGVFDVLKESRGEMLVADNPEALYAGRLFEETEGIDIDPASAVAFASLLKASRSGQIERDSIVLLHITGGGRHRRRMDKKLIPIKPDLQVDGNEILSNQVMDKLIGLFR